MATHEQAGTDPGRPLLRLTSVTVGTDDPHGLAHFYARLLGWPVGVDEPPGPDEPGGSAQIGPPRGQPGPTLSFEYEQHFARPVWPAVAGEQVASQHLDIQVEDLDAATAWAVAQGATLADAQPQADVRVLRDPSGHPFCLFR
ncbi:VOC family protein [Actinotalea sp. K2]|uniref:VOC family protein n=1 Tax=Actinotalea sp. K2 TaxID=2939438 RepID=UPI002016E327|nr:VOC family protein [Actinotalea sp. K2]MCL3861687.1 VOC family protein [Actinotalea sp. K2]